VLVKQMGYSIRMSRRLLTLVGAVLLALAAPAAAGAYVECSSCEAANQHENEAAVRRNEEKEKAAKEQKAAEERSQREMAERQHHEEAEQSEKARLEKEEGERKRAKEAAAVCIVPSLRGDSLKGARGALRKAHCELGGVTVAVPRGYHGHGAVVVRAQSLRRGTRHTDRTAVAITLGPAKAKSS
jgi:hypothetical protein